MDTFYGIDFTVRIQQAMFLGGSVARLPVYYGRRAAASSHRLDVDGERDIIMPNLVVPHPIS